MSFLREVTLKGETGLREQSIDARDTYATLITIFKLERGEVGNIIANAGRGAGEVRDKREDRVAARNMDVLKAIIRLPQALPERQPVRRLNIPGLTVELPRRAESGVTDIGELGDELRIFFLPHNV